MTEKDPKPRLTTPSIVTVIQGARLGTALTAPDRRRRHRRDAHHG